MNKQIDICKELGQNFIDFSYEANSARAFADARDGLKPGQRACLWEMFSKGYLSDKKFVKSAKIDGAVAGNWWPHGNVAIYETFTRMSQPWINNLPEVDWHGNNGSQFTGPEAAADRYTEARLSKAAEDGFFQGIKKCNVNMISNYAEDDKWPEVLPAIFPRLMVNGCQGIGSTIANVWIPHNFKEISNVIIKYIETNQLDYSNLYPDFPTKGIIINQDDIHSIYETGKGKVVLRGKAEIKDNKILITELPYQVYVQPYVEMTQQMAIKDEIKGIEAIYNKSGKDKLLIEIECSENPQSVLNNLYLKTILQKTYNANQWALVGKTPQLLNLKQYCDIYIRHNIDCLIKETNFDLNKAKRRLHIVEGLLIALENIDNIITLIKKSESAAIAKINLINQYKLDEDQAKAILDMKLSKLAKLEKIELETEKKELLTSIEEYNSILNSIDKQKFIIKQRLEILAKKYGTQRRTKVTQIEISKEDKEIATIIPEDVVVMISKTGEAKRIPKSSFRAQRRNGKGVKSENDAILTSIRTNTIDTLLIFTNKGKMYKLLVDKIPAGTNASKGQNLSSLITMEPEEKIVAAASLNKDLDANYVVFITKQGLVKKTLLEEYTSIKKSTGTQAIKIKDGDSIVDILFMNEEDLILFTKEGMIIRFTTNDISPIGRVTSGVKGIKLNENDIVVRGIPITNKKATIAIIDKNGYGKRCKIDEFIIQGRGGKGLKTGCKIAGAELVTEEDNLLLMGKPNSICISATELVIQGRNTIGTKLAKNNIDKVVKI